MSWQVHDVSYNTELCHTLLRSVWKSKIADTIWKIYHTSIWYLCLVSGCSITKEDKYCRYIVQVFNKIIKILCSILYSAHFNNIDGAMDSVVASSVIDPGFEPRSGQNPKTMNIWIGTKMYANDMRQVGGFLRVFRFPPPQELAPGH
jgi:hypothetical protein